MTAVLPGPRPASRAAVLAGGWSDLRATEPLLNDMNSAFLGICRELVHLTYEYDDIRGHYAGAATSSSMETLGFASNSANGGGGFSLRAARSAAIGETVERYSAAYMPAERLVSTTARELGTEGLDPDGMTLFSRRQYESDDFPFRPFTRDTKIRWVEAYDLRRERSAWIPAQVAFLNSRLGFDEERIVYSTSNGLACGPTRAEATASGLLELVERDPLMIAWHAGCSLPLVDLRGDPTLEEILTRFVDPAGLTYDVVDLTSVLGVPTALAVVRNTRDDVGALALGAASRPTLPDAAVEALLEAFQTRTWCKGQQRSTPRLPDDADFDAAIRSFDDHVRYYGERDRAAAASFLTASNDRVKLADAPALRAGSPLELVESVLERLPPEVDVYAVDLTAPDIAAAGLSVVKVYSPQLQPLDVGWRTRFLGGRRIYEVPHLLGYADALLGEDDLTTVPHPFP